MYAAPRQSARVFHGRGCKSDGRLTGTETGPFHDGLRSLGLKTDVELEAFDVAIQLLGRRRDLRVGVPFEEVRVPYCVEPPSVSRAPTLA